MSKCRFIFITGGNRGIGLQLVKDILPRFKPEKLFATYRTPEQSEELKKLASENPNLHLIQMDIRDYDKYPEIVETVESVTKGEGLNLLINNAGISGKYSRLHLVRKEQMLENFEVNTVSPIMLTKALLPLLEKASEKNKDSSGITRAAVVNTSSVLGSITENETGGLYPYRCSKTALNAATRSMSIDLKNTGIVIFSLHPGWVQTDMGGKKAPLTTEESSAGIVNVLDKLNSSHNGKFIQWDGKELPW